MAGTLTAANSVILLSVANLYDVPQQLQGFAADDVFDTGSVTPTETSMGVDGKLSGGFVFNPIVMNVSLQADSDSNIFFENWIAAMVKARETYIATGQVALPSVQRKYAMVRGFLTSHPPTAPVRKTLQPRRYTITWEQVTPAPY